MHKQYYPPLDVGNFQTSHSILKENQIFSSVFKLDFPPFTNSLSQVLWLVSYFLHFLLKPLVCNKNITSSKKMNHVVFLVLPLHFLPLQFLSHYLLQFLNKHQHLLMVWKITSLVMSNKLKSCASYYQELLSRNLSHLLALKSFSLNVLGTACLTFFTKTKTGPCCINISSACLPHISYG